MVVSLALVALLTGCDFLGAYEKCVADNRCPEAPRADGGTDSGTPDSGTPDSGTPDSGTPGWCGFDGGPLILGPTPYARRADSPFQCDAGTFVFDDFEQGAIHLPGVTVTLPPTQEKKGELRAFTGVAIDSVDEDDGAVDGGRCMKPDGGSCAALYTPDGLRGITLEWDAGALPQFVGLAWTDGRKFIRFEAFGANQESLGVWGPDAGPGFPDGAQDGQTQEDRFFGAVSADGISKVWIGCDGAGGMEIDHVHYGRWSPGP